MNSRVLKDNERIIKFRAWKDGKMEYSHRMPDVSFWQNNSDIFKIELMQFTGKRDCRGRDIYEGDIVKYFDRHLAHSYCGENEKADVEKLFTDAYGKKTLERYKALIGIVKWDNRYQAYEPLINDEYDYDHVSFLIACYQPLGEDNAPVSTDDDGWAVSYYEVIGNIYETPELIPSKSDEEMDGSHDT